MPPKIGGLAFSPGSSKPHPAPKPVSRPAAPVAYGPPKPGVNAPVQTNAQYQHALKTTFDHQSPKVKAKIVAHAQQHPSADGNIILAHARQNPGAFLHALNLGGKNPFADALTQGRAEGQRLTGELPNPPRLFQAPELSSYTPAQKDLILREQGPRLSALEKQTGVSGDQLVSQLPKADARQVALFSRLVGERQRGVGKVASSPRAISGHKQSIGDRVGAFGAAFVSPKTNLLAAVAPGVGRLGGPLVSDAANLVMNTPESLYMIGDAAVQAPQGNLAPAKRIGQGLASGVIGHAVRGDFKGAAQYAGKHPLFSALELSGAEGAIGRTAGAVMRSGAIGDAARAAASTVRAPIKDTYGRTMIERSYSKDVIRKAGQAAYDKHRFRNGVAKSPALQARLSRDAVDEFASTHESLRRMGRQEATKRMAATAPVRGEGRVSRTVDRLVPASKRPERDILQAVVEGRVRPTHLAEDLTAERARLATAFERNRETMTSAQRLANQRQIREIDRVLNDPKALANVAGITRAASSYKAAANLTERHLVKAGVLQEDQALAAKLRTHAVAKMGARYDKNHTAPEHMVERYQQAQQLERDAAQRVAAARTAPAGADRAATRTALRQAEQDLRAARRQRELSDPKKYVTGLVGADGKRLSSDAIVANMKAKGFDMPAFVSHRSNTRGAKAFLVNWFDRRATADAKTRTGKATELGAHASDFISMAEQHIHAQGTVDAVHSFDKFVHQFGLKHPSGRMLTWDEAQRLAADPTPLGGLDSHGNPIPGHEPLVPVRTVPARYSPATRDAIEGMQGAHAMPSPEGLVEERIRQAQLPPDTHAGAKIPNTVLVPASEMKRFAEHQQRYSNTGAKLAQAATNAFRSATLPFSTKWVAGNTVEAALRLTLVGATPRDVNIGRRLMKSLEQVDEQAAREFRARTQGGLMFGGSQQLAIHRSAEAFKGGRLEKPAMAAGALRRAPGVKQIADGITGLGHGIFAFNRALEQGAQYAALGKMARTQIQETTGSWLKSVRAAQPALDDLAKGLVHTPAQVRYARYIDETLGKYSRFGPTERRIFQTVTPFLPWYLNSLRFVFWTLPAHHPIKQALIANVENNFQKDFDAEHKNVPPGDLKGGVVNKDGSVTPLARYMPFGAFTGTASAILAPKGVSGGAIGDNLAQAILPQVSGALAALRGKSWTGADLRTSHGKAGAADQVLIALNSLAESFVPGMSVGRRLREDGLTSWDNSTLFAPKTKPNTKHGSALNRVFNPFRPTYLKKTGGVASLGAGAPTGGGTGPSGGGTGPSGGGVGPSSGGTGP